jgi:hypothetical protein
MCHHHQAWQSIDVPGLLGIVDMFNGNLSNASVKSDPSETTTVVYKALGNLSAGGPVWLLSWGMALNTIGSWSFGSFMANGKVTIPLIVMGVSTVLYLIAGIWLQEMAHIAKSHILTVDASYANNPKIGWEFWTLLWSAIAVTILSFIFALVQLPRLWKSKQESQEARRIANTTSLAYIPPVYDAPPVYETLNSPSHEEYEQQQQTEQKT